MVQLTASEVQRIVLAIVEPSLSADLLRQGVPDAFNLLSEGVLDSFGFIELVTELEHRLAVAIDLDGLEPEEFGAVGPLSRHIAERCIGR